MLKAQPSPPFGELLGKYRRRHGISQRELGEIIHRHRSAIDQWEREINQPKSREDILLLEGALQLSQGELDELLHSAGFPLEYHRNIADAKSSIGLGDEIYGYLHPTHPVDNHKYYELRRPKIVIGRNPHECDIVIPAAFTRVSRIHAVVYCSLYEVYVTDADSTRGTFVDGDRVVERTRLQAGQHILLGGRSPRPEVCVLEFSLQPGSTD